jgi:hypothetical protein
MPTSFDFIQVDPNAGVGFAYKSSTAAFYFDGTTSTPIGQNSVFVATTGSGTTVMNISSVTSGTVAVGQIVGNRTTVTFTAPSTVNWASNGLSAGDTVKFLTTGTLPTGLSTDKTYFVKTANTNDITLAATSTGPTLTFSGTGTGTHTGVRPRATIASFGTFNGTSGTVNLSVAFSWSNPTTFSGLTNFPAETVRGFPFLDGTYYVMTPQGSIHGSAINDPTNWSSLNVIQSNAEPDGGVGLFRQLNLLVSFNTTSTEFFYDAANPTGSPLLPYSSAFLEVGCASGDSIAQSDNTTYFMGVTKQKGRGIYRLNGTTPEYVSNAFIDRVLNNDDLSNVSAICIRIAGHGFYVLYLEDSDLTLVFDATNNEWANWTINTPQVASANGSLTWADRLVTVVKTAHGYSDGDLVTVEGVTPSGYNGTYTVNVVDDDTFTYDMQSTLTTPATVAGTSYGYTESPFTLTFYTSGENLDIVQDSTTGYIYFVDNNTYADNTYPIDVRIRTAKYDAGNNLKKFVPQLEVIGDKIESTAYVRYTNDDYQTWSKYRPVSLDSARSLLNRMSVARRRAYELRHHDNCPLRLEALEINPNQGTN